MPCSLINAFRQASSGIAIILCAFAGSRGLHKGGSFIYTDGGGKLPALLANAANEIGISKIFIAIRNQVKLPKYSAN